VTILLLTKRNCAFCDQAKAILARLTAEYPVSVSTLDLATSEGEALALRGGVLFAPGVFLDDVPFSYGRVSEKKLRREIERRLMVAG
jgi:glutaredoxin